MHPLHATHTFLQTRIAAVEGEPVHDGLNYFSSYSKISFIDFSGLHKGKLLVKTPIFIGNPTYVL